GHNEVFMRATALEGGLGVNGGVVALSEPGSGIEVVRAEVFDDSHVCDAGRERALAARRDLIDVAEITVLDPLSKALERRVVALDVTDCPSEAASFECVDEAMTGGRVGSDGLLDECMDACFGEFQPDLFV